MNDRSISSPQFKRLVDEPRSRRGSTDKERAAIERLDEITRSWSKNEGWLSTLLLSVGTAFGDAL